MSSTKKTDPVVRGRITKGRFPEREGAFRITEAAPRRHDLSVSERLFSLYDRMLEDVKIPGVLSDVAEVTCEDLNAERASIYLINSETEELESVGVVGNVARTIRVPICETSLAGFCALTGKSFVVPDAYGDLSKIDPRLRFDRHWDEINNFRTRDVMCAPARFKDKLVGVVQAVNSRGAPFEDADLSPLNTISRLVGYALYHARLYDDLATMKELDKHKAEFMRIMVHELKSPVATSKMMTDALAMNCASDPKISGIAARISDRMGQMLEMIGELLHLAKVKSGDPLGEIVVVDLRAETEQGCQQYYEPAEQQGLELKVDIHEGPIASRFDSQGYRLVLSNLISNAVKYTQDGHVRVTLRPDKDWAVLEVEDTGMGIPEADVPKLFKEFFRASNAKQSKIPGSGVGLAGAKNLVERFGGVFALESIEGKGSKFIVRLPLHVE